MTIKMSTREQNKATALVHRGCCNKCHRPGGLATIGISFSRFWRLEAWGQGASTARWAPASWSTWRLSAKSSYRKGQGSSPGSLIKHESRAGWFHPHDLSPEAPPAHCTYYHHLWRLGCHHTESWGTQVFRRSSNDSLQILKPVLSVLKRKRSKC